MLCTLASPGRQAVLSIEAPQRAVTLDEVRAHRDAILRLGQRFGVRNIRVFGSVARGEATPGSDLDLLLPPRPSSTGGSPAAQASASYRLPPTTTRRCSYSRGSSHVKVNANCMTAPIPSTSSGMPLTLTSAMGTGVPTGRHSQRQRPESYAPG
jgi:Nucleotidyltransferase domain